MNEEHTKAAKARPKNPCTVAGRIDTNAQKRLAMSVRITQCLVRRNPRFF